MLQVQYAALHNFEDREEDFRADVVTLRRRFTAEGDNLSRQPPSGQLAVNILECSSLLLLMGVNSLQI